MLHTRLRPHCKEFLEKIAKLYELHVFTFGSRLYAHTIAGNLISFPHIATPPLRQSVKFYWDKNMRKCKMLCGSAGKVLKFSTCAACESPLEGGVCSCSARVPITEDVPHLKMTWSYLVCCIDDTLSGNLPNVHVHQLYIQIPGCTARLCRWPVLVPLEMKIFQFMIQGWMILKCGWCAYTLSFWYAACNLSSYCI